MRRLREDINNSRSGQYQEAVYDAMRTEEAVMRLDWWRYMRKYLGWGQPWKKWKAQWKEQLDLRAIQLGYDDDQDHGGAWFYRDHQGDASSGSFTLGSESDLDVDDYALFGTPLSDESD